MTVDLSPVAGALVSLAAAAVTATIPILVPALLKRLRIADNADLTKKIEVAADAGAGVAYQYAASRAGGLSHVAIQSAALAAGADYVSRHASDTLVTLNITPARVSEMVAARLGVLLAGDPTVTAGTPVPAMPSPPPLPIPVSTVSDTTPARS
jgi:hypothetical protein